MTNDRNSVIEAIAYIDKRLATIERAPRTWGTPESLELQTLLLLEVRFELGRHKMPDEKRFAVRLAYIGFIKQRIKNASAEFLAPQLERAGRIEELPQLLAQFRDQITGQQKVEKATATKSSKWARMTPSSTAPWLKKATEASHGFPAPPRMGNVHAGASR